MLKTVFAQPFLINGIRLPSNIHTIQKRPKIFISSPQATPTFLRNWCFLRILGIHEPPGNNENIITFFLGNWSALFTKQSSEQCAHVYDGISESKDALHRLSKYFLEQ